MAAVMAVQHFSSSFLFDFHPAGKPHGVHMTEPISKDNTQTGHPSWAPAGLLKRSKSKEVMFCVPFGGWREERRWRKSNKCVCGNRDHLSLVFALRKGKKKTRLTVVINEIRVRSSKSRSTWRRHGYNNPHSRKR